MFWEVSLLPTKSVSYRVGEAFVHSVTPLMMRLSIRGLEHVPADGPCIVVVNHVSHADPFPVARVLTRAGRLPRFLAKNSVFTIPLIGPLLARAGQIPVARETGDAAHAIAAADRALLAGECIVIYPEGTLTRDPDLWPMRGKLGAARLALQHGCPVIPMATWGAQAWLAPYARWPRWFSHPNVRALVGPPVQLTESGADLDADCGADGLSVEHARDELRATQAIMAEITALVAELRGQEAPETVWNPRAHGQPLTGDPRNAGRARRGWPLDLLRRKGRR